MIVLTEVLPFATDPRGPSEGYKAGFEQLCLQCLWHCVVLLRSMTWLPSAEQDGEYMLVLVVYLLVKIWSKFFSSTSTSTLTGIRCKSLKYFY